MYSKFDMQIDEILSTLTLKEKIGQLNQVAPSMVPPEKLKERIRNGEVGSLILANSATAGNDEQEAVLIETMNELQRCAVEESRSGIPMIFGRDVIHGHHTVLPVPLASACSFNPELVKKAYRCVAKEAVNECVQWTFSPMLDVCHDPRWGRIVEGPGEDPYVGSRMARAIVEGFQGEDLAAPDSLAACSKHYLGYGASEGGRDYFRTEISDYTLYNLVLPPFREAVKAGAATVMSSFNDINGQPVTSSKKYLTDILRGQLGFEGYVVSDWASVDQLQKQGVAEDGRTCAKSSILAGLDMEMVSAHYVRELEELVLAGEVPEEVIDESVRRILRIKLAKGLFERPYCSRVPVDREEHMKLAEELAAESMVLLKNEGEVLPLRKDVKVALCGPYIEERKELHGTWSLDGIVEITPNMAEAMKKHGNVDINGAYEDSDVIVLALGESRWVTGETKASSDCALTKDQIELVHTAHESGKKVVGVIFCGRPIALGNVEPYLDAILIAWHGGTMCAEAAAKILYGDIVPSGKTAATFVRTSGQIPLYYNATSACREVNGYYGENPESNYVDVPGSPLYPFGYGLSYTTFEYTGLSVKKDSLALEEVNAGEAFDVSIKVKNTGTCKGKEVVQLYIHDKVASLMRPQRELKGYQKIELEPGEAKDVTFSVGADSLGFYDNEGTFVVEKGRFELFVGENCFTRNKVEVCLI